MGIRQLQGLAVFDPVDDRPSVWSDPSTVPTPWDGPSPPVAFGLESSRPLRPRPRVRRGGGGWWPGLLVFGVVVAGGLALLTRVLR